MRRWTKLAAILLVVAGAALGVWWVVQRQQNQTPEYRTAPIERGELVVTISATGTLEPEEVVDVGAQVAGQILAFGTDSAGKEVDYNSVVDEGTVLARIDDSLYKAAELEAQSQVQSAQAGLARAQADLEQLKAKLDQAEADWQRAQKLGPSEALAQASYDAYKYGYETAKANVVVGQAAIEQAKAAITQAQAGLTRARRNLGYCTIKSPVNGVIIDRRVNIGQTVVASLNAPSLFLIAKDLRKMQVWVAVNEADIGRLQAGQPVTFTVDALPNETFRGQVGKIRQNAAMTQNVVTYTVEIETDNSRLRLRPYLTANVLFEVDRRPNVLMAPVTALRWTPPSEFIAPAYRAEFEQPSGDHGEGRWHRRSSSGGSSSQPSSRPWGSHHRASSQPASDASSQPATRESERMDHEILWVTEGRYVKPVKVRAGASDGVNTEVRGEGLTEGMEVVTGVDSSGDDRGGGVSNPFGPRAPSRRGGGH